MRTFWVSVGLVLLATTSVGCNRVTLNDERTVEVGVATLKTITLDPVKKDQKIKIEFSSPGAAVNVFVCLEKDAQLVQDAVEAQKQSDQVLAHMENTEGGTLEAAIPANNAAVILITNASGKKATVKVKTTN